MTQEKLQAFLAKVKGDSNLQELLKTTKSIDEVVAIMKENVQVVLTHKLRDEELEGVTGSTGKPANTKHYFAGVCGFL